MTSLIAHAFQPKYAWLSTLALMMATIVPLIANSQESAKVATTAVSALDGFQFNAGIVRSGDDTKKRPLEDKLIFRNGRFSSVVCKRYNFKPSPYWIRREGDRIHFLAELFSPTDGKMVWRGTIQKGRLTGTMQWTRKRWYWTINAKHTIRGELSKSPVPLSSRPK